MGLIKKYLSAGQNHTVVKWSRKIKWGNTGVDGKMKEDTFLNKT